MKSSSSEESNEKYIVPALERGMRILEEFGRESRTLGAPELARRLNLPRATVFRLLNTLESMGFLERSRNHNEYRLSVAVLRLGFEYLASLELTELGQGVLTRLCEAIKHPCNIAVLDGRHIVYVAKVAPPSPFTSALRVGTRLPAHATIFGRVLLGDYDLPALRALYPEEHLEVYSEQTPKTVLELFNQIQEDKKQGYAVAMAYYDASTSPIAAPIRDDSGRIVAAIGATVPANLVDAPQMIPLAEIVRQSALEISHLLNYREDGKVVSIASQRKLGA